MPSVGVGMTALCSSRFSWHSCFPSVHQLSNLSTLVSLPLIDRFLQSFKLFLRESPSGKLLPRTSEPLLSSRKIQTKPHPYRSAWRSLLKNTHLVCFQHLVLECLTFWSVCWSVFSVKNSNNLKPCLFARPLKLRCHRNTDPFTCTFPSPLMLYVNGE